MASHLPFRRLFVEQTLQLPGEHLHLVGSFSSAMSFGDSRRRACLPGIIGAPWPVLRQKQEDASGHGRFHETCRFLNTAGSTAE